MDRTTGRWTLGELAEILDGRLCGPGDLPIERPVPAGIPDPQGIAFAGSRQYMEKIHAAPCGAVIVDGELEPGEIPSIRVRNARASFFRLLTLAEIETDLPEGIHLAAIVHPTAEIDPTARVGAYAVIEANALIGPGAQIHPHASVGPRCTVGSYSVLKPRAVLVQDVRLGERCLVHSGAVIGADGFGFEWNGEMRVKIPQIGGVLIGNDVEIGANSCIDRATVGDTVVGDGTKIDNLCQVGHNVILGKYVVLCGMVGIGGSSVLGDRVIVGASTGISDHITIGDDVVLGGRTSVASDINEPGEYFGQPAQLKRDAIRTLLTLPRLPEIWSRLKRVEESLERLDKDSS